MALIKKPNRRKRKTKKRAPLTPEQRRELAVTRAFENQNRSIFIKSGFARVAGVDGKHFEFEGVKSEIDDIFIYENVIVFAEYTQSSGEGLGKHAKGKSGSHNKIAADPNRFVAALSKMCSPLQQAVAKLPYTAKQLVFKQVYCSDEVVEDHHRAFFSQTRFISRSERVYFSKLSRTIKKSARYELFNFLGIPSSQVGSAGVISATMKTDRYHGSLLPEEHSNFPPGYRITSFYIDPEALLKRAYVLRRGGWRDSLNLYQRMIIPAKINGIRKYLREQHRVFANNIVITLPDNTEFRNNDDIIIDSAAISVTTPTWVHIKDVPNSVGIVDGQHRVFSYYEDLDPDPLIDHYRKQQNLLVTGIVYPHSTSTMAKEQFEAALFLERNSNQSGARSDLKQAIWLILDPFRPVSVARTLVNRLASLPPLGGVLERTSYDVGRLPTTTIVTYGMQPLVKRSGKDSLFAIWNDSEKSKITEGGKDLAVLERYLNFSAEHISDFLVLVRGSLDADKWRIISKEGKGVLSVTTINSFLILMRKLIDGGHITHSKMKANLQPLNGIKFKSYKSSQYAALASAMYKAVTA